MATTALVLSIGSFLLAVQSPATSESPKPANLRGYTLLVPGGKCPAGSSLVGFAGAYGAEDVGSAAYDRFLYRVTTDSFTNKVVLRRDKSPLVMSACRIR